MGSRRQARELALQLLYQTELTGADPGEMQLHSEAWQGASETVRGFADELLEKDDQAVLIDLDSRRFFFFWIEIWPHEFYFVAGLLIMAGLGLFLFTSALGRVWCGWGCPQTVYMEFLYRPVERLLEGRHYRTGGRAHGGQAELRNQEHRAHPEECGHQRSPELAE